MSNCHQGLVAHSCHEPALSQVRWHPLDDHLRSVGKQASQFASHWQASTWAEYAGLWHDLGKYRPGFQQYIRSCSDDSAHIESRIASSAKTHSAAGALHAEIALSQLQPAIPALLSRALVYTIACHHSGLSDWQPLCDRLWGAKAESAKLEYQQAYQVCLAEQPELLRSPPRSALMHEISQIPSAKDPGKLAPSIWIRMLFSSLVDADFLDTESFMDGRKQQARAGFPALDDYLKQLNQFLDAKADEVAASGRSDELVMRARSEVLKSCREKSQHAPGFFSLTVPTGGGKTLSSLAFALNHAIKHSKRRVIYAIPYTSIIEQTADVFGSIFGAANLVEHHSQFEAADHQETVRSRLACENWDAPLIVTTNVQLFESLFAAKTSRCRKLHNLTNSVIVLDEAQLLPTEFLQPILDTLRTLVTGYGVSVVLCTATQPTLGRLDRYDATRSLRGLGLITPIIDDEESLFTTLRRVRVHWPVSFDTPTSMTDLANQVGNHDKVLAIVNTRADALELTRTMDSLMQDSACIHLSAAMCGAHRSDVIKSIRERLAKRHGSGREPIRVISTQLVEAGVDIDFPVVYRALGGLDSIAQAAGRCNREGRLPVGDVHVVVRPIPRLMGNLRAGAQATRTALAKNTLDNPFLPTVITAYFNAYYAACDFDKHNILPCLTTDAASFQFDFKTAADRFRLVDSDDHANVVVPYTYDSEVAEDSSDHDQADGIHALIRLLRDGNTDRWLVRKLQRYSVTMPRRIVMSWLERGDVEEPSPGVFVLIDELRYHPRFGLLPDQQLLDSSTLVQ